jgi:hypothetical protein
MQPYHTLDLPVWQLRSIQGLLSYRIKELIEATAHLDERDLPTGVVQFASGSSPTKLLEHRWGRATTSISVTE